VRNTWRFSSMAPAAYFTDHGGLFHRMAAGRFTAWRQAVSPHGGGPFPMKTTAAFSDVSHGAERSDARTLVCRIGVGSC